LSNVVAVASGGNFGLALTTGKPPPSVYIIPHGSLEIMERDAEVIFKGLAIRSVPITNTGLIVTNMEPHETTFKVVSRIKGNEHESEIRLQHYSRPMTSGGGGPGPPANYQFEPGNNYIVFAYSLDKEDGWYRPTTNASSSAGLYRQFAGYPTVTEELWGSSDQGAMRALDGSDLRGSGIKEVHWFELNRLLNDSRASYQLYAIKHLDTMSQPARTNSAWGHSDDFKRSAVLEALAPLIASQKEEVARRAIRCFATDSNAAVQLAPFATALVKVANESPFPSCRYAAIAALSGEWGSAVSNSVAQLVSSTNEEVRLCAMTLLPRFPQEFSETLLRELANDKSPYIRSVVADVVAAAKYSNSIPIIAALFADSAGVTSQARGLPRDAIRFNLQSDSCGDVRQSAGVALLAFDTSRTGGILKSNLNDPAFHVQFLAKLAEHDAEPWLKELVDVLESRIKHMEDKEKLPADDPERYSGGDNILQIPYLSCWEDLRRYLLKLPSEKLVAGPQLQYVDLLERCVRPDPHCPGCSAEQVHGLYELYKEKGLSNRSDAIRNQFKNEAWWFDDYDKRH
jgi:hypothetical protein